jgi:excisionase family DNA binding protein
VSLPLPKFLTVKQVSQALGVSTNTVYKYLDEGKIKSKRVGGTGRFRISESELTELLGVRAEHILEKSGNHDNSTVSSWLDQDQTHRDLSDSGVALINGQKAPQNDKPRDDKNITGKTIFHWFLSKLSLHEDTSLDMFDWFLSLSMIFLSIGLLFFPSSVSQSISLLPFQLGLGLKISLLVGGMGLMLVDILSPNKNHLYTAFKFFLFGVLMMLLYATAISGLFLDTLLFAIYGVFLVLSSFWHKHEFLKLSTFIYIIILGNSLLLMFLPYYMPENIFAYWYGFSESLSFLSTNVVAAVWALLATFFYIFVLFFVSKKFWWLLGICILVSLGFLAVTLNLIDLQQWTRAFVSLMIGSFVVLIPFSRHFESIPRFSRKTALISFAWLSVTLVIAIVLVSYTQQIFRDFSLEDSYKKVQVASLIVDNYIGDSRDQLVSASKVHQTKFDELRLSLTDPTASQSGRLERSTDVAKNIYLSLSNYRRVLLFDKDGNSLSLYPYRDGKFQLDANPAQEAYFKNAVTTGKVAVSDSYTPRSEGLARTIYVAVPIKDEHGVWAVMVGSLDLDKLTEKLSEIDLDGGGYFVMADTAKTIFMHSDRARIGKQVVINRSLLDALEGRSGYREGYGDLGTLNLQAYAPIKSAGWGILIQQPSGSADRQSTVIAFSVFMITILSGIGLLIGMSIFLRKKL